MKGILITDDFKPVIKTGSLAIGDTTSQNQHLLLLSNKGDIKEYPLSGVGVQNYLENHSSEDLAAEIRKEFTQDGMKVKSIKIDLPSIEIDAVYE